MKDACSRKDIAIETAEYDLESNTQPSVNPSTCNDFRELIGRPTSSAIVHFKFDHSITGGGAYSVRSIFPLAVAVIADPFSPQPRRAALPITTDTKTAVIEMLKDLLSQPLMLIVYDLKRQLQCLWALSIEPTACNYYDLRVAAASLSLGKFSVLTKNPSGNRPANAIAAKVKARDLQQRHLSLPGLASRYGVSDRSAFERFHASAELITGMLSLDDFPSDEEIAATEASVIANVYHKQSLEVAKVDGLRGYLDALEFRFTVANARMEWNGAAIDPVRLKSLQTISQRAVDRYSERLRAHGIYKPSDSRQFIEAVKRLNLTRYFPKDWRTRQIMLDDDTLDALKDKHEIIGHYREWLRFVALQRDWKPARLHFHEGRLHAGYEQLLSSTGRNKFSIYQFLGMKKSYRPLVIPTRGYGLIEFDWEQIEPILMAAMFGEASLLEAYSRGDLYSYVAQLIFVRDLSEEDRVMPLNQFREKYGTLREQSKEAFLAIIYGMGPWSLALKMGVSEDEAERIIKRIYKRFPKIKAGLDRLEANGRVNGYVEISMGLRRYLAEDIDPTSAEADRRYRNTPIQGLAAMVLKIAVTRLDLKFKGTRTKLVSTLHDSILVEAPLKDLTSVIVDVRKVMELAANYFFDGLILKVDVNDDKPLCWNQKGKGGSFEAFLKAASEKLDQLELAREKGEFISFDDLDWAYF